MRLAVCVDFDGTITDLDTFDVLVARHADARDWASYANDLQERRMTLREVLATQTGFVRGTLDEADALIADAARVDPSFVALVRRCERDGIPLLVLSSGIQPLIERALARAGAGGVRVLANGVRPEPDGWSMTFRDDSDNGHDKAAAVRELQREGYRVLFAGDAHSDFDAALAADVRFAKRGHALERFLTKEGARFASFSSFDEIDVALDELLASSA